MLKGATHIHSTYSDGEFTLAELRKLYTALGCSFVFMSDHAEAFNNEKLERYVDECKALSDETFCFVAGLEYECERRMHILGFGSAVLAGTTDPQRVISHIRSNGGVSVIAHPMDSMFDWIESFETLPDGVEVWNSKYDGRYAPRPGTFRLLNRLQERQSGMLAFYGQDMHWKKQYRGLFNVVELERPTSNALLSAFKGGSYQAVKGDLKLPSNGELTDAMLDGFGESNARSARRRGWIKAAKRALDRMGVAVPASLKARVRRIF